MKTNGKKLNYCVNNAIHSAPSTLISVGGTLLESTKTLKLLGFTYGTQPGVKEHVEQMVNIFLVKL